MHTAIPSSLSTGCLGTQPDRHGLFYKPNIPIAIIEAKDNNHTVGDGLQQALGYAEMLQVPFVFSSNGDGFLFHNQIAPDGIIERELLLNEFPSPQTLWQWWAAHRGLNDHQNALVTQDYYSDGSDKNPRYYQLLAINKTIEAIARGQNRILLVMATGTGKTFTAFQIIWRLWKAKAKKRILFLADRNILIDQTMTNDFKPFGPAMTKIQKRQANKSYEIYLSLYQARTGTEDVQNIYKQFSPDFFDLIVIDECHRGSAAIDSAWREILEYVSSATQIGLNRFIAATDRKILQDAGKVTAEIAKAHAESEFEKYRIVQDRLFESDFDRMLKQIEAVQEPGGGDE